MIVLSAALLPSLCVAQMATISSNGFRGICGPNCKLSGVETDVRIDRHQQLDINTEVKVVLQQILTEQMQVDNGNGTTSIVEKTTYKTLDETEWKNVEVNANTTPNQLNMYGFVLTNPNGDNRYGTFRLIGKMRTFIELDDNDEPQFTNPITFVYGKAVTLRCSGCGGGGGGGQGGGPGNG